jgi:hypothetical protein
MAKGSTRTAAEQTAAQLMARRARWARLNFWVIGVTPLICHAWSEKAKQEMLAKQVSAIKPGKEPRDPQADFLTSQYEMKELGEGVCGFPVTGFKKALIDAAHNDKGIPKTDVMAGLWLNAVLTPVRPALAGAKCNMPLVRIWGEQAVMREDMVRVGIGLRKTASFTYRAEFWPWAFNITGRINADLVSNDQLSFLVEEAGQICGLGDWRNQRSGVFGAFRLATGKEEEMWRQFSLGRAAVPEHEPFEWPGELGDLDDRPPVGFA